MEIYNETITDLLCDTQKMKPLIIREDFNVSNRVEVSLKLDLLTEVIIKHLPLISVFLKCLLFLWFVFIFLSACRDHLLSDM